MQLNNLKTPPVTANQHLLSIKNINDKIQRSRMSKQKSKKAITQKPEIWSLHFGKQYEKMYSFKLEMSRFGNHSKLFFLMAANHWKILAFTFTEYNWSDPSWGGRNYILKWVFLVQTIFADRYINRRELRLVSL